MRTTLASAVALLALLPATAVAGPRHPTRAHAEAALAQVHALGKGHGVRTGFELSPALAELAAGLPSLGASDRRVAESLLARPSDNQADPLDTHKWAVKEAQGSPYCGVQHFCIHWVDKTADAPDLSNSNADPAPDYVEQMAAILENEVYPCENGTAAGVCAGQAGFGWRDPAPDGGRGGNDKTDVYIEDLYTSRIFGYVAPDPGQSTDPSVPHFAYMVLDKDYRRFANGDAAGGLAEERVTAAHEYNHVLQYNYDFLEDPWMFESTAVYMEDKVYPQVNDYLQYVRDWTANTRQPLTAFPPTNLKAYGSAVWNHWLDHRYGAAVVRSAWERSVASGDFAPGAYGAGIASSGGAGFSDEFERFSAAVAEWDAPNSGFPDAYPDIPRDGILVAGSQTSPFSLAHTTFAFFDVPVPAGAARIRLTATLPVGTRGAVALIGRTGSDPAVGSVTSNLTSIPAGGLGVVQLDNPGAFGRITAVVVNSDPSQAGFSAAIGDWVFTKDAPAVVAAVIQPGPPIPTTGGPSAIADHSASVTGTVDPDLNDTAWSVQYGQTTSYGSTTASSQVSGATVGAAPVAAGLAGLKANTTYHYRLVASNVSGVVAGQDMTFTTARDVTPPLVTLKVKRQKLRTARKRGALYLLRCSERCVGTAELRLGRRTAKRLGTRIALGKSRVVLQPLAKPKALRARLSRRARVALAGRPGRLRVVLRVRVADESHNRASKSKRFTLVP